MPQDPNDKKNVSGAQFVQPPESFAVRSATSRFSFATDDVTPPGWCYVGVDDQLELGFILDVNASNLICNVRILRDDGVIVPLVFAPGVPAARTIQTTRVQLVEGYLLSCTIMSATASNQSSINFGWAALIRPPNTIGSQYELLCSGNLFANIPIGFPESAPRLPTDGMGQPRLAQSAIPAAGADFVFTVPANTRMRIISLDATLTTSAAVANRNPALIVDDGANVVGEINAGVNQAASLAQEYTWGDTLPFSALFGGNLTAPLPSNLILPGGWRVRSETTAIDVADQWTNANIHVIEWLDVG